MTTPRTAAGPHDMDILWSELLLDACASDGPIRDNDVRQAIARYRPRIEAEARAAALDEAWLVIEKLRTRYEDFAIQSEREHGPDHPTESRYNTRDAALNAALAAIDDLRERSGE